MTFKSQEQSKGAYLKMVFPLVFALLIQRVEHLVDNRFMVELGSEPLKIHSVFYILFIIGQAIGVASSASLLTLWNRKECLSAQSDLAKKHIFLAILIGSVISLSGVVFFKDILNHFHILTEFTGVASIYLGMGLMNIILQALLGLTLTLMIVTNERLKSFLLMIGLLIAKFSVAYYSVRMLWNKMSDAGSLKIPMALIGATGLISVLVIAILGLWFSLRGNPAKEKLKFSQIFEIWNAEIGIAAIRAIAPAVFIFQLGTIRGEENYYVIYQLALQGAYFLVLPILGANQIAVRDASGEQSARGMNQILKLEKVKWFSNYLICALLPTQFLLFLATVMPVYFFKTIYGLEITKEQATFLSIYYFAVMIGQIGNFMQIRLRSIKLNRVVTFNTLISEIFVQLGLMQLVLILHIESAISIGIVTLIYCLTHLGMNAWKVQRNVEGALV